jgi:DNA ligase-4
VSASCAFLRVGTGVSDEERRAITEKLRPYFIPADPKRPNNPSCYRVTGTSKERPDVWVSDPFKSIVLKARPYHVWGMSLKKW